MISAQRAASSSWVNSSSGMSDATDFVCFRISWSEPLRLVGVLGENRPDAWTALSFVGSCPSLEVRVTTFGTSRVCRWTRRSGRDIGWMEGEVDPLGWNAGGDEAR
jgi:hypothetical protein